jgi:hypothetical protein
MKVSVPWVPLDLAAMRKLIRLTARRRVEGLVLRPPIALQNPLRVLRFLMGKEILLLLPLAALLTSLPFPLRPASIREALLTATMCET